MGKIIIGTTGQIASGKDALASYVVNKYKAKQLKTSTVLRDILKRIYKDVNRENLQKLSLILRQNFGEDLLANIAYNDIQNSQEDVVIIDGIRRFADIEMLKPLGFKLIFIDTAPEVRYERLIQRSENIDDRNKTFEEFQKDAQGETEIYIANFKDIADYVIDNNGNFEDLYKQFDKIIEELRNK